MLLAAFPCPVSLLSLLVCIFLPLLTSTALLSLPAAFSFVRYSVLPCLPPLALMLVVHWWLRFEAEQQAILEGFGKSCWPRTPATQDWMMGLCVCVKRRRKDKKREDSGDDMVSMVTKPDKSI